MIKWIKKWGTVITPRIVLYFIILSISILFAFFSMVFRWISDKIDHIGWKVRPRGY